MKHLDNYLTENSRHLSGGIVSGYTLVDMRAVPVFVPLNEAFFCTSSLFFHVCVIWVGRLGVTSWNSRRTMGWTFCNILFSNLGGFVDELHFFGYYIFLYWVFRLWEYIYLLKLNLHERGRKEEELQKKLTNARDRGHLPVDAMEGNSGLLSVWFVPNNGKCIR